MFKLSFSIIAMGMILLPLGLHAAQKTNGVRLPDNARISEVVSLDGPDWQISADPKNVGREEQWWNAPQPDAKRIRVPGIMQEALTGYHGVAWYWRDATIPANQNPAGRYLLRFWMVDYLCDVWVNGKSVGKHEGGEDMFILDVTDAVKPDRENRIAVRVLNPTDQPIDGIMIFDTPRRNKTSPYSPGADFNYGGITDSVELLMAPVVRVEDLFANPNPQSGEIVVQTSVRNAGNKAARCELSLAVAPAASGETLTTLRLTRVLEPGTTVIKSSLWVKGPRLWNLNDPILYRVSAKIEDGGRKSSDEQSTRCGFRDFRFEDGYFRLNGKRIFLKSSHTAADTPVGVRVPLDPDMLRRDFLNCKVMGFNMIRLISGLGRRYQMDLADEIGLMVYDESFSAWGMGWGLGWGKGDMPIASSPALWKRFDNSTIGMIKRDRNHPSVVIWGLLNETANAVFRHAVKQLPLVRSLDDSRMVMLNSGTCDGFPRGCNPAGLASWTDPWQIYPNVSRNGLAGDVHLPGSRWYPGQLSLAPGWEGERSVVRWTAPQAGQYQVQATFYSIEGVPPTTDVHLFSNGKSLLQGLLNMSEKKDKAEFTGTFSAKKGDTLDAVVGMGNETPFSDSTGLTLTVKSSDGKTFDAAKEFSLATNPSGVWSYGFIPPGPEIKLADFKRYSRMRPTNTGTVGSLANPGSMEWEDVVWDVHPYKRVPHTATIMRELRETKNPNTPGLPIFMSEYGVGSAVDVVRLARHYEQLGMTDAEDARKYHDFLDDFLRDWNRWGLADTFASPEDYFRQCLANMAGQRLLGINAIRSNPNIVGYNLTGTQDQGMTAEGLTTTFRELKPGTVDAVFEGFYPLRWCLFAEPVNVYRGAKVHLEAVLANEDVMRAGAYPVRVQVVGPDGKRILDRQITVTIPDAKTKPEPPFALPMFSEDLKIDGPTGKYRFLVTFAKGGAAAGGETEFHAADPADMPKVNTGVVLWGDDPKLSDWLKGKGINAKPFQAVGQTTTTREVILVGNKPADGGAEAWRALARRIAQGSTAIFLCHEVFKKGEDTAGWLPRTDKGRFEEISSWLYHKDEWAKKHPIFSGLPTGLMDYTFYRDIIPDIAWTRAEVPDEVVAGCIDTAAWYAAGLFVGVQRLGEGRFVLNTLKLRENLGTVPWADWLVLNMLNDAARDIQKPAVRLPDNFEEQLKAMGYK